MTIDPFETLVPGSPTKVTAWELLGIDPDYPGALKHTDADLAAAEARGYQKAMDELRAERDAMRPAVEAAAAYVDASRRLEHFKAGRDDLGQVADAHSLARGRVRLAVDAYRSATTDAPKEARP